MDFYNQFQLVLQHCLRYQSMVDDNGLWLEEPYQTQYLNVTKLIQFEKNNRADIESAAAVGKCMVDHVDLPDSRREYYELQKVVPEFLASGSNSYYYLQNYYIRCFKLLKDFSYSRFVGDYDKIYVLQDWLAYINDAQASHDSQAAFKKSIEDIKQLGNFDNMSREELQLMQVEVMNIQSLLSADDKLQESISAEDAELYRKAAEYLANNSHKLEELPPLPQNFEYKPEPFVQTVVYRCQQLVTQADHFPDLYDETQKVTELYQFKQELESCFDLSISMCADVYYTIIGLMGSLQSLSIHKLCDIIERALEPFLIEKEMDAKYNQLEDHYDGLDAEMGMPDTVQLYKLLCIAVGAREEL